MELSNKKVKENGTHDMGDDTRSFGSSTFRSGEAENDNRSFPEVVELNENLNSFYALLGQQQQQRAELQERMDANQGSEEGADFELLMSLELQRDILEEKIVETLKNIQMVAKELEAVREVETSVSGEAERPEEERNDQKEVESSEDDDDAELDELVSEMIESGTESLEEVEELFSETLDEIVPGETEVEIKVEEAQGFRGPMKEEHGPERMEVPVQEPEPLVPESAPPESLPEPASERAKGEDKAQAPRPKLTRTLISEIEEASSSATIPLGKEEPQPRKRPKLKTTPLEKPPKPRRKRLKADWLKSATVLSFKKCTNCKAVVPANFKICGRCGETLKSICPICGTRIPRGVEYCSNCNKRVMY